MGVNVLSLADEKWHCGIGIAPPTNGRGRVGVGNEISDGGSSSLNIAKVSRCQTLLVS